MDSEVFADGIGDIGIGNGVVRINLISFSPTEKDAEGKPIPAFKQRIIIPVDGFLRSFSTMERFVNQLVQAGVVKRAPGGEEKGQSPVDLTNSIDPVKPVVVS